MTVPGSVGVLDAGDVAVGSDAGIRRHLGMVPYRGEAQTGGAEQLAPLRRRLRGEHLVEDRPQVGLVVLEVQERVKPLDQIGPADGPVEEVAGRACGADDGDPPVGGREDAVDARDHGVAPPARARHLSRQQVPGVLPGLGPELAAEQRRLDQLSAARALPRVERGQDAREEILPRDVVGDGGTDRTGVGALAARRADQPAGGLGAEVCSFACRIGTLRSEGGPHGVDDPLVAGRRIGVPETPRLHRPRLEVGDHDIGVLHQAEEDVRAPWARAGRSSCSACLGCRR